MTQAFETENTKQASEDVDTQRKLKFLNYLIELAIKDPEWNGTLKDMTEQFGEAVPQ